MTELKMWNLTLLQINIDRLCVNVTTFAFNLYCSGILTADMGGREIV